MHELLTEIGLTRSEIAVYLALLDLGSSSTGPIIKKAGIASGKAYLVLDKLILKGLVTYTLKGGTKHYQAKNPEKILEYLQQRKKEFTRQEEELKQVLPALKAKYEEKKYTSYAEIYEGVQGLKTLYDWIIQELKKGEELIALGIPREFNRRFEPYFLDWNRRRVNRGISMRVVYNADNREYGRVREKMRITKVRYLKITTPVMILILRDYVVTVNPLGTPLCFLIRNKETSESYRKYFEILWKQGKK